MSLHRVNALVLPIFRRYWLWHAWTEPAAAAAAAAQAPLRPWREGPTLEAKFSLLGQHISSKVTHRIMKEWHRLEAAPEGTLRNRGYRLAQAVLAREDPRETFLKQIPTQMPAVLEVMYPEELPQRLCRRRLRALVYDGHRRHRSRLVWWVLALIPQLPLMLTPLPNITVYYTIYRIVSHSQALQGCKAAERGFATLDSHQLASLRDDLLRLQASGVVFPEDSWPARLIKRESKYLDIFDRLWQLQKQRRLEALLKRSEEGGAAAGSSAALADREDDAVPTAAAILQRGRRGAPREWTLERALSWFRKQPTAISNNNHDDTTHVAASESASRRPRDDRTVAKLASAQGNEGSSPHEQAEHASLTTESLPSSTVATVAGTSTNEGDAAEECTGMRLRFTGSDKLSNLVAPRERLRTPLGDEAALMVGREFEVSSLLESVARARRRAVGSMFPASSENWGGPR